MEINKIKDLLVEIKKRELKSMELIKKALLLLLIISYILNLNKFFDWSKRSIESNIPR